MAGAYRRISFRGREHSEISVIRLYVVVRYNDIQHFWNILYMLTYLNAREVDNFKLVVLFLVTLCERRLGLGSRVLAAVLS